MLPDVPLFRSLDEAMAHAHAEAEAQGVRQRIAPVTHPAGPTLYAVRPEVSEPCS